MLVRCSLFALVFTACAAPEGQVNPELEDYFSDGADIYSAEVGEEDGKFDGVDVSVAEADAPVAVQSIINDANLVIESLGAQLESVRYGDAGLVCDVLSGGATVAAGITVALGVTTAGCVAAGGTATLVTLGGAAVVAVPACATLGAGTLAAGATSLTLYTLDQLVCRGAGSAIIDFTVQAGRAVVDFTEGVVKLVVDGVSYMSRCSPYHYAMLQSQKAFFCRAAPRSCVRQGLTCTGITMRIVNGHYCLAARRAIQACWGSLGDTGHETAVRLTREALARCQNAALTCRP
ncbi:MAG: hypothetical protein ACI9KE_003952 [Polyangiales bacterium]